jgi:hypothetical protein
MTMSATTIEASCHCGAVKFAIAAELGELTDCNCSICRRYGALWAYFSPKVVRITPADGAADVYMWGERMLEFHRCKKCGCVTHWLATKPGHDRMGVNARLLPPDILAKARVRRFDGADTWKELD